jgi:hypothetical protein|mmetsp:Transcript_8460/g.15311  ORF Transcript_8460/g.15311 Transcript_8460/m.15311 type:complete len:92 (-) Transcript_8460:569-844(-)|eukprot:CAMPEP_0202510782 /NCGR_PEP_ID=MMETSP1361-20130828/53474_1 /ASSEMBLY_ACC=CAM_ASM_000849 /TAXON_ID=210615 /ORGANISM="Staurosira complex sp., Strain CCMP2646" /LENGTH=91 /DNA_ID=CAMNT_0049145057 /DNA_START=31 /DNA_END=306 /DNA_ORIENTATION=+
MPLKDLTENQTREVLELLNASHPSLVHSAVSQVLEQESVVTVPVSNTSPSRTHDAEGEEGTLPPLLSHHQRSMSNGDQQPRQVTHESTKRL